LIDLKLDVTFQQRVARDRRRQGISPELPPESERNAIREQYVKNAGKKNVPGSIS